MRVKPRRPWSSWKWACASVVALTAIWYTPEAAGYVQGRVEASMALSKGRAELRTIGHPRNPRGSLDPETGLVSQTLGCVVSGWAVAYKNGWNAVMRDAVASGKVDTSALRAKVTTIEAMKARFAAEPGFSLPADGTPVADRSRQWEVATDELGTLNVGRAGEPLNFASLDVRGATCVFADRGSTLCVRRAGEWGITYETIDLERRITLQEFHEDTGKPRPST